MKRAKKFGFWVTAAALGCLLFMGCNQSSTEDPAVTAASHGFWVPVTLDPDLPDGIAIGDGSGAAVVKLNDGREHSAQVKNTKPCSGTPTATTCTIAITNLDPDYYMANVFVHTSWCADCVGDKFFSNADIPVSDELPMPGCTAAASTGFCGHPVDINAAGFCVVEDGVYGDNHNEPSNYYGCPTVVNTKGDWKPLQFIHPDCGSQPFRWDFSTATGAAFSFYMYIEADYFPEVPIGPDLTRGTGDDDSRFDFQNRTTMFVTLNSLNDDVIPGAPNKAWWRLGSYKRSSALAGYGSGGGAFTPAPGRYFAVNVLGEYPDRIESYPGVGYADEAPMAGGGTGSLFSDYEYYINWSWVIRYDPTVVNIVASDGAVVKLGSPILAGGAEPCDKTKGYCQPLTPTWTGLDGISLSTQYGGVAEANGYVFSYNPISVGPFLWNQASDVYRTTNGGDIVAGYSNIIPVNAAQLGLARVSLEPAPGYTNVVWYASTALIPSGTPDPEPELGLGMYYFKVLPGTSGKGTQFYADMWATEGGPLLSWTNGTAAGGFYGASSDDWAFPCLPIQPGYEANYGCNDSLDILDYYVYHGTEPSNPEIHHSGYGVPGGGTFQYWNTHLCVQ